MLLLLHARLVTELWWEGPEQQGRSTWKGFDLSKDVKNGLWWTEVEVISMVGVRGCACVDGCWLANIGWAARRW